MKVQEISLNIQLLNVNAAVGILVPFGGYKPTIPDKYFERFRGFHTDGVGPRTPSN